MLRQVIEHAPTGDAMLEGTLALVTSVIGIQSAWFLDSYQTLTQFCRPESLVDANRRQTCSDMAEVMVGHSDTLLDQGIGAAIGQRSGWPLARVESLRRERNELTSALGRLMAEASEQTCSGLRRQLDYFARIDGAGEWSAMQGLVAQSPSILGAQGGDRAQAASYPDQQK
jgi:hypothetical protein